MTLARQLFSRHAHQGVPSVQILAWLFAFAIVFFSGGVRTANSQEVIPEVSTEAFQKWEVTGTFLDSRPVLEAFLKPVLEENRNWDPENQKTVTEFLMKIGYESTLSISNVSGVPTLKIAVEPKTLVRHIAVDMSVGLLERLAYPVFGQDLQRRMTLRPASTLSKDKAVRKAQLQQEADRLAYYLHSEGFFDATVSISEEPAGKFAARLNVKANPGDPYTVGKIEVSGNTAIPTEEITKLFSHRRLTLFERPFSREQLQLDIERLTKLYQSRGYPGVRIRTDFDMRQSFNRATKAVEFRIDIREKRKIDIVFEGLPDGATTDVLMKQLTLNVEGSYDDVEIAASAESVRRYYQREGRYEAGVTWSRVPFGVFERILFEIDEGPQLPVRAIYFRGNEKISDDRLSNATKTQVFRRLIIGESGGYLTNLQLEQDVDRIKAMYQKLGFEKVQINVRVARGRSLLGNAAALAASVAGNGATDGLYVLFDIKEGPFFTVGSVDLDFSGSKSSVSVDALRALLKTKVGVAYVQRSVVEDATRLNRYYFSKGFPRAEITPTVATVAKNKTAVVFEIVENNPATIGKIAVRGNFKTKPWVIADELQYKEGDSLTIAAAEQAQSNLRSSGLFTSVNLDYRGFDSPRQEDVNVVVSLQERHDNAGELQAGFGFATNTKLFGEAQYQYQNIGGIGAKFSMRGILGQQRQLLEAKIGFPRWIPRRLSGDPV